VFYQFLVGEVRIFVTLVGKYLRWGCQIQTLKSYFPSILIRDVELKRKNTPSRPLGEICKRRNENDDGAQNWDEDI
jgi:hypothetical protein